MDTAKILERPEVEALIAAAIVQNTVPFAVSGGRKLIIRSISKKQKARRKTSK